MVSEDVKAKYKERLEERGFNVKAASILRDKTVKCIAALEDWLRDNPPPPCDQDGFHSTEKINSWLTGASVPIPPLTKDDLYDADRLWKFIEPIGKKLTFLHSYVNQEAEHDLLFADAVRQEDNAEKYKEFKYCQGIAIVYISFVLWWLEKETGEQFLFPNGINIYLSHASCDEIHDSAYVNDWTVREALGLPAASESWIELMIGRSEAECPEPMEQEAKASEIDKITIENAGKKQRASGRPKDDDKFNKLHDALLNAKESRPGFRVTDTWAKKHGYRDARNLKASYPRLCKNRGVKPVENL